MGIRHKHVAVGTNDPTKQVSVSRWNEDHEVEGEFLLGGLAADPVAPLDGTLWLNTTTGEVKARSAGVTQVVGGGSGGVTDGDKGHITVSLGGTSWTIDDGVVTDAKIVSLGWGKLTGIPASFPPSAHGHSTGEITGLAAIATSGSASDLGTGTLPIARIADDAVTLAKLQNFTTDVLLGRDTAGTGDPELIGVGGGIEFNGAGSLRTSAFTGDVTKAAGGTALTLATVNSNVGSFGLAGSVAQLVVNAKGLITSVVNVAISIVATQISDATAAGRAMLQAASAAAQTALLDVFGASTKGLVPSPGGTVNTTDFLRRDGAWAPPPGGGGVTDGDKGDITVSGSGATWTIDADTVTLAKLANFTTDVLLGRDTAGTGDPELIGVGGGIEFNGAGSLRTSAFTGDVTKVAGGTALTIVSAAITGKTTVTADGADFVLISDTSDSGNLKKVLVSDFGGGGGGAGDVVGPASATDNALARFDATTGKLIQNSGATLDDNGVLTIPSTAIPAAPAAGHMSLFARTLGARVMPAFMGPSGLDAILQPGLAGNRVLFVSPTSGTTAPAAWGGSIGTAGTASFQQTFGSTNRWLSTARKRYTTTTTAGNAASTRQAYPNWMRGSAAGFGGFYFRAQFGININLNGSQCFVGLCPATGALGGDPSTDFPLNMCGMGFDAADLNTGNWKFFRNDGAGGVVKIDLGADAARTADVGYELVMFMAPGGSELFVQITNLNTGADILTTSYTTDIPAVNTGLCLKCDIRNGAVAAACNIEWAKIYLEADY